MDRSTLGAIQQLENLQAKAKADPVKNDLELQAQIARFLCVLASGVIEQVLVRCLERLVARRAIPSVANYASSHLTRISNAKFTDILATLGRFDPKWREHFEQSIDQEVKDAIDSVVNNRNQVSHGRQAGVSLIRFGEYYGSLKPFLIELDAFIDGQ
jgi:hypothetical protein